MSIHSPSNEILRKARRSVEDFAELRLVQDLAWCAESNRWTLCVDVVISEPSAPVPASTRWWMLVDQRYPWGTVEVYPDSVHGVTETFEHQDINLEGDKGARWRTGDVCLRDPSPIRGRRTDGEDPLGYADRLGWYFRRLIEWVKRAASGTLSLAGDPFEMPKFKTVKGTAAFSEDQAELARWAAIEERSGFVSAVVLDIEPALFVLEEFQSPSGTSLISYRWGSRITNTTRHVSGVWIRCPGVPKLPPHHAVQTWGQMRAFFSQVGDDLDLAIKPLLTELRNNESILVAFGFPIPATIGEATVQMHWQVCRVGPLSSGEKYQKGFRKGPEAYWLRDRRMLFGDSEAIMWLNSENWASIRSSSRGHLPETIRQSSIVVLGVGAVGSVFAEQLVRGGVEDIALLDSGGYDAGNCVRHTLLMEDTQRLKSDQVAKRLNRVSPFVHAESIAAEFPELLEGQKARFASARIIVDCTGSDDLLAALSDFPCATEQWFCSISISREAQRVFVFTARTRGFPMADFVSQISPWMKQEPIEGPLPREGPGCWHPVFPARMDSISLLTASALQHLVSVIESSKVQCQLAVFERKVNAENGFVGLERVDHE